MCFSLITHSSYHGVRGFETFFGALQRGIDRRTGCSSIPTLYYLYSYLILLFHASYNFVLYVHPWFFELCMQHVPQRYNEVHPRLQIICMVHPSGSKAQDQDNDVQGLARVDINSHSITE